MEYEDHRSARVRGSFGGRGDQRRTLDAADCPYLTREPRDASALRTGHNDGRGYCKNSKSESHVPLDPSSHQRVTPVPAVTYGN